MFSHIFLTRKSWFCGFPIRPSWSRVSEANTTDALDKALKGWVFNLRNLKSVIEDETDLRQTLAKTKHSTTHTATHPTQR